jgi:hypothetical protein
VTADQRVTSAREYLGHARNIKVGDLPRSAVMRLAAELRRQLGQVLDVIGELATTAVRPDGSAQLSVTDVQTALSALAAATWWAEYAGRAELIARYHSLARSLGDDR